jgi:hypothetical protein
MQSDADKPKAAIPADTSKNAPRSGPTPAIGLQTQREAEAARLKAEKLAAEKVAARRGGRAENARKAAEKVAAEKAASEKAAAEKLAAEKTAVDKREKRCGLPHAAPAEANAAL